MIHTSKQLKDKVRNATMDIDATVKSLPLNMDAAQRIVSELCAIPLEDCVTFRITSVSDIMTDFEYPGVRMVLEAVLERMRQVIKIDISTDDVITPSAVEYEYKLMFEDRTIPLLTYNAETLLAEKIQTILAKGIANTRLRDYYDVYEVMKICEARVDKGTLLQAFSATCKKRETIFSNEEIIETLTMIEKDAGMAGMWDQFRKKNYFVGDLEWKEVPNGVLNVIYTYIDYLWEKQRPLFSSSIILSLRNIYALCFSRAAFNVDTFCFEYVIIVNILAKNPIQPMFYSSERL